MEQGLLIGMDYGTDSVRSVLIQAKDGKEIASHVYYYERWAKGKYCDAPNNRFRQHPQDYIDGLETTITHILSQVGPEAHQHVKGIAVDTTGSTPVAVDRSGQPLALQEAFAENPNAMFVLWKDHTSLQEAAEINTHNAHWKEDYLRFVGGIYSSEWFWAKMLHILREDASVAEAAYSWVEHCDWIPFLLTGGGRCA